MNEIYEIKKHEIYMGLFFKLGIKFIRAVKQNKISLKIRLTIYSYESKISLDIGLYWRRRDKDLDSIILIFLDMWFTRLPTVRLERNWTKLFSQTLITHMLFLFIAAQKLIDIIYDSYRFIGYKKNCIYMQ